VKHFKGFRVVRLIIWLSWETPQAHVGVTGVGLVAVSLDAIVSFVLEYLASIGDLCSKQIEIY
jgi:hypothetical protein